MSDLEASIGALATRLGDATRVVALTGAGASAESGVPTFRGAAGLWKGYDPQTLASVGAFENDPETVWEWYDWRRGLIAGCAPNPGHQALAELERRIEGFTLVTQNVDRLHQDAGSRAVIELHGDIWTLRCFAACGYQAEDRRHPLPEPRCPACGARLRPGVVWFGEMLPAGAFQAAEAAARVAEVFLVVGTSSVVYPAAGLSAIAAAAGAEVFEINPQPNAPAAQARQIRGPAGEVLPRVIRAAGWS